MNLRHWLKKTPRPAVVMADDKRIEVPNNVRAINDLVATIEALDPSRLTCMDKDGGVIRSVSLEDDDKPALAGTPSPEMSDLQFFARLLADGYENGRKANQPIIDSAMQFVEAQGQRLLKAEAEIERLRAHIHKLNAKIGELSLVQAAPSESAEDDGGVVGALLAGAMQGMAAKGGGAVTPIKTGAKT